MSVEESFGRHADVYDRSRRQLVPCFDDFYGTALMLGPGQHEAAFTILDLGAGTGLLTALFAEAYPRARFTLVDVSREMLNIARKRFLNEDRFALACADIAEFPNDGPYNTVISALSIHHLEDAAKQRLFARVYAALKPDGAFINADQVLGSTPAITERNRLAHLAAARDLGVSDEDLGAAIDRMKHDRMATLEAQLRWMENAGFRDVDCAYKNGMFAVYSGCR